MIQKFATSVPDASQVNSGDITAEEENEYEFPLESLTEELIGKILYYLSLHKEFLMQVMRHAVKLRMAVVMKKLKWMLMKPLVIVFNEKLTVPFKIVTLEEISLSSSNVPSIDESTQTLVIEDCNMSRWQGFKIVGDNIDKNFRPSYQRIHLRECEIQLCELILARAMTPCYPRTVELLGQNG